MARASTHPGRPLTAGLDRVLFGFAGLAAAWLAVLVLQEGLRGTWQALLLIVFWLLVAYLVLPRLHRMLTFVYLPDYFIGRTRTSDGLLGDPVNLALLGEEDHLHAVLSRSGWTRADRVTTRTSARIIWSTLLRRGYAEAPVSPLLLFDRPQDFAYQQEVSGSPTRRHHVRFWRCPDGWMLPGGFAVDWLGAGTYDRNVGVSLFTLQVTHRISQDIDTERDYIIESVTAANPAVTIDRITNFSTGYHARNGGGDRIVTDGHLPVIDVRPVEVEAPTARAVDVTASIRPPAPTIFGTIVASVRGTLFLLASVLLFTQSAGSLDVPASSPLDGITSAAWGYAVVGVADLVLAVATYRGHSWARLLLMLGSVVAVAQAFTHDLTVDDARLHSGLSAVTLSILVLLALTSHRARDFSAR